MCIHQWARSIDGRGHILYACIDCPARVDFTEAREEYDRLQATDQTDPICYDETAGFIETPARQVHPLRRYPATGRGRDGFPAPG